jgi:hypothetical protein
VPESGLDCAPPIRIRTASSAETLFKPLFPLGSAPTTQCKTHLVVRITGGADPIGEFTLTNLSKVSDEDDRFWAELKRTNPTAQIPQLGRAMATESPELACEAMKFVGCRQSSPRACLSELAFLNRTRHVIAGADSPTERTLYQCLITASTVEQVNACGVACEATPQARHAWTGATFPTELFTTACARMSELECGGSDLGQCDLALQSRTDGWFNADCVESARTQADVLYCGASCGTASGLATLFTESFEAACSNLKAHQCSVGLSKTCEDDLRAAIPLLRKSRPNPHECLAEAKGPIEILRCGVACVPPKSR